MGETVHHTHSLALINANPILVVCLGYNSLHDVRTKKLPDHDDEVDKSRDVPLAKRVWNWLLLTGDKTVISISEDPFPFTDGNLQPSELKTLYTTRRNLVSVFRQLTKAPTPLRENSLVMLPIRHRIGDSEEETAHRPTDAPGLLFYYLFEDWFTTYSLVTRREHGYAAELDRLVSSTYLPLPRSRIRLTHIQRREMLIRANLSHVDQLHHIGCQLAVLKRVYQAYELIIERVLKKQEATLASLKNSHIVSGADSLASSIPVVGSPQIVPEADSLLGVSLSSAARARFERLKDRILLYALSEIQECIDQKDSLVMMVSYPGGVGGGKWIEFVLFLTPDSPRSSLRRISALTYGIRTSISSLSRNPSASSASPG